MIVFPVLGPKPEKLSFVSFRFFDVTYRPELDACQISINASSTGSSFPSNTIPSMLILSPMVPSEFKSLEAISLISL